MKERIHRPWTAPTAWWAIGFTACYLFAAAVGVATSGNREFAVYLVVVIAATALLVALHHRIGFSPGVVWGLSLLGAAHMAGGLTRPPENWPVDGQRVLYNWWLIPGLLKFDQVVHAFGSGIATWACWQGLLAASELRRSTAGPVTLCALAGMGLGAVNEVAEFMTTRIVPDTNVGGFSNTGWDLVSNTIGCVAAGVTIWLRNPEPPVSVSDEKRRGCIEGDEGTRCRVPK